MIEVGQTFGKYRLVERIATGGMAEIFKAAVRGADGQERAVVIKRLHRSLCDDAELTRMLVDEARISVLLDHPNIGQVFDLGVIDNQVFIVMACIDGRDAHEILDQMRNRREFLPVPAAIHIVSEACKGLHYAHTLIGPDGHPLNLVHRDVSPQNIMVTFDGRVVLVDFGIAKARMRAQTTQAGVIKGKFYYMAPEQAHGHHVDARADVFAAGMVLYEMITATSPYQNISDAELLRAVRVANIPPPSAFRRDIDPELERIVMTAVARDPNARFQTADEFRYALEDYAYRKFPPVNHREQMAHFVHNLFGQPPNDGLPRMDRQRFMASDESMIFARPSPELLPGFGGLPGAALPADRTEVYDPHRVEPGATARDLPSARFAAVPGPPGVGFGGPPGPTPQPDVRPFQPPPTAASATQTLAAKFSQPKFVIPMVVVAGVLLVGAAVMIFGTTQSEPSMDEPLATVQGGEEQPVEPVAPVAVVPLALNSVPSNATVKIDGVSKGSTPIAISVETGKTYRIEFEKHGYAPYSQDLMVTETVAPLEVKLEEMDGVLKIASYPGDAVVKINNREVGHTPLKYPGLTPGTKYLVAATYNGETMTRDVSWEKGESAVIDVLFEFEKAPKPVVETVVINDTPKKSPPVRVPSRRATSSRKRVSKPKPEGTSLKVWSDSEGNEDNKQSDKKTEEEDSEGLQVWGDSKEDTTKKKDPPKKEPPKKDPPKKDPPKKKQAVEDEKELDIW